MKPADITATLANPEATNPERELEKIRARADVKVIFDIGACEGEDSVRYAQRYPHAEVHTFEPLPSNQALVRANFNLHRVTRARLVPLALSDREGEATFHISSGRPPEKFAGEEFNYGNKSSSLLAPAADAAMYGWVEFKEAITVKTDTLDHYCATQGIDHIDLIHLDVQGAESLVLKGAERMLARTTAVWMEVSDEELYRGQMLRPELQAFMQQHGFRLRYERRVEVERDQFYLNTRLPDVWLRVALGALRGLPGRAWRAVFG